MSKDLSLTNTSDKQPNFVGLFSTVFGSAFVFFGSQFLAVIAILLGLAVLGNDSETATDLIANNMYAQAALTTLVGVIITYVIYRFLKWRKEKPQIFLLLSKRPTINQVGEVALTYGLYFISLLIVTIFLGLFTGVNIDQAQDLGISTPSTTNAKLVLFLMLAVVPPIYEEILFRGFLFNMLKKYSSKIVAFTLTCVLFGVAHLEYDSLNWIAAIDTLVFSAFLIYISQKHQSLYSAMLLHAIKNSVAFYVLFVRV